MTKVIKGLEYSDVLMKGMTETSKNDEQKGGALPLIPMLLGTLGVSLLSGKGLFRAGNQGKGMYRVGQGMHKAGQKGKSLFSVGQGTKKSH